MGSASNLDAGSYLLSEHGWSTRSKTWELWIPQSANQCSVNETNPSARSLPYHRLSMSGQVGHRRQKQGGLVFEGGCHLSGWMAACGSPGSCCRRSSCHAARDCHRGFLRHGDFHVRRKLVETKGYRQTNDPWGFDKHYRVGTPRPWDVSETAIRGLGDYHPQQHEKSHKWHGMDVETSCRVTLYSRYHLSGLWWSTLSCMELRVSNARRTSTLACDEHRVYLLALFSHWLEHCAFLLLRPPHSSYIRGFARQSRAIGRHSR